MSDYPPGAHVRVRDDWPEARGPAHIRTPHYVRGRTGRVLRALGRFPDPEALAFARPAVARALYHVSFALPDLWPDTALGERHGDAHHDDVLVELYEHWLEPAP